MAAGSSKQVHPFKRGQILLAVCLTLTGCCHWQTGREGDVSVSNSVEVPKTLVGGLQWPESIDVDADG
jgi:hypothetical protein